jgi:PTH1 family peptidyl-tRNA hydrolase
MTERWLIVGLGNPGNQYDRTRHNAGFWFLDALSRAHRLELKHNKKLLGDFEKTKVDGQELIVLRPQTFMNDSGQALRAAMDFYDVALDHVLVAYDDLDLSPGDVRLKMGGGHGGHNGLRSAFAHCGGQNFWRLRIGIGHPGSREQVTPWVLGRPSALDEEAIGQAIQRALPTIPLWWQGNSHAAMKQLHTTEG